MRLHTGTTPKEGEVSFRSTFMGLRSILPSAEEKIVPFISEERARSVLKHRRMERESRRAVWKRRKEATPVADARNSARLGKR